MRHYRCRRKSAATEIEKRVLELNRNGDHETVQGIIAYLNKEFIQSQQSANHRQLVLLLRNPSELENT